MINRIQTQNVLHRLNDFRVYVPPPGWGDVEDFEWGWDFAIKTPTLLNTEDFETDWDFAVKTPTLLANEDFETGWAPPTIAGFTLVATDISWSGDYAKAEIGYYNQIAGTWGGDDFPLVHRHIYRKVGDSDRIIFWDDSGNTGGTNQMWMVDFYNHYDPTFVPPACYPLPAEAEIEGERTPGTGVVTDLSYAGVTLITSY